MQALTQPALNLNLSSLIPFAISFNLIWMAISDTAAFISQRSRSQSLSSASTSGNLVFLQDPKVRQMSELDGNTTHFVLAFSWDPLSNIHLSLIFEYLANCTVLNVPQSRYIFLMSGTFVNFFFFVNLCPIPVD